MKQIRRLELGLTSGPQFSPLPMTSLRLSLLIQVRVDLGVMVMKEYSIYPWGPGLELYYQTQFSIISGHLLVWEYDRRIVQPQVTGFGVWLGLCHIDHCGLFNANSSLYTHTHTYIYIYIYIYIWFGLVVFYDISNLVDYLKPNPLYTYILNIYDLVWLDFMAYQP